MEAFCKSRASTNFECCSLQCNLKLGCLRVRFESFLNHIGTSPAQFPFGPDLCFSFVHFSLDIIVLRTYVQLFIIILQVYLFSVNSFRSHEYRLSM